MHHGAAKIALYAGYICKSRSYIILFIQIYTSPSLLEDKVLISGVQTWLPPESLFPNMN